jgi:branched-chain amino acid aminotransferase
MGRMVWMDGSLLRQAARVPVTDHAFLAGDGAFETIAITAGIPIAVSRHLARLRQSLAGLGLSPTFDDRTIREAIFDLIRVNGGREGWVRLMVTAGDGPFSSTRGAGAPRVFMASAEYADAGDPIAVVTVPWTRNERGVLSGLKSTSYAENVVALAYAGARGAREAIFPNTRGELCEGTGSNIFLVCGSELVTPPLSSGCLAGVTRALVISVSGAIERPIPMEELPICTEACLTSSTRGVLPIVMIDDRELPVGPLTAAAREAYDSLVKADPDP